MSDEVRAAVFGNVGSMITFRVGSYDAEVLEKEFAPQFVAQDIVNLGFAQIYLKLMINNVGSQPFSATTLPRPELPNITFTQQVIQASRTQFGKPRATVEDEIRKWHEPVPGSNNDFIPKTKKVYPDTRVQQPQSSQSQAGQPQRKYPPREGDRPPRQTDNADLRQQLMRATGQNFPEKKIDGPVPPERQNVESRPIDPNLAPAPTKGQPDTRQESSEKSVAQAIPVKPPETHQPFKILMQQVDIAKAEEVPQTVVKQAQPEKPQVQVAKSVLTPEMAVPQAPKAPLPVALQKPSEGLVGVPLAANPLQSTSEQKSVEQKGERREQSPISLKTLQRRDKGPSEQNLNVLKNALEQAMKKQEPPSVLQTKEKAPEQTIERRQETRAVDRQPERPRVFQTDRQIPPRTVATETRRFDFKQPERNQPLATVVPEEKKENAPRQQSTQTLQQPEQPQFQTAKTYDKPPVLDEREQRSFQTDNIPERRINEDRRSREVGVPPVVQEQKVANEQKSPQAREDVVQTREQSSKKEQEQQNQFDRRSSSFMPEIPEDVLRKVLGID
jgi:hypothetical protein